MDGDRPDPDRDGYTNMQEFEFGSDPQTADADNNEIGIPDAVERRQMILSPIRHFLLLVDDPTR